MEHTKDPQLVAYEQSCRDAEWSRRCLFALLAFVGVPKTFLDVGCGSGHLVRTSAQLGVLSEGWDVNIEDAYSDSEGYEFTRVDLTEVKQTRFHRDRGFNKFDLTLCWETAEHLPPESADTLCDTLATVTAPGGLLVFTAARPGQGGSGHLNEQPRTYWRDRLRLRGLNPERLLTRQLSTTWSQVAPSCPWYGENVQVFRKGACDAT